MTEAEETTQTTPSPSEAVEQAEQENPAPAAEAVAPPPEAPPEAPPEEVESPEEELARLRQELEEAKAQAAEYLDGWQRARAEFANYRKRQAAEREELIQTANATLLSRLLPILDDFERAFATLPQGLQALTWIEGILLIQRKLQMILEAEGVKPIEVKPGDPFDPLYHEAVTYEESEAFDEGQIIGEVQKGYRLKDRVLRPALVRVAKAKPRPAEKAETTDSGDETS